jgi:ribonuclease III
MSPLEVRIGYKFRNTLLLAEALTHPSLGFETKQPHFDNQRLEFLGDAVLQLIFTEHLYQLFPGSPEGQLTKLRARLVSRDGLKDRAAELGLGAFIMMGRGEEATGGRKRASILANTFEALIGAMYLDGGFEVARQFALKESGAVLQELLKDPDDANPKGELQELLQAISPRSPTYEIVTETGPDHQRAFEAMVCWEGLQLGRGQGKSKKQAEAEAARTALGARLWVNAAGRPIAEVDSASSDKVASNSPATSDNS